MAPLHPVSTPLKPSQPTSTSQSTTCRLPPQSLEKIAERLAVPVHTLNTLSVPECNSDLYSAILEYALYACTDSSVPILVPDKQAFEKPFDEDEIDMWKEASASTKSLDKECTTPDKENDKEGRVEDGIESSDDGSDDSVDGNYSDEHVEVRTRITTGAEKEVTFKTIKNVGKGKPSWTKPVFGLGSTVVSWPPPKKFEASVVAKQRDENMKRVALGTKGKSKSKVFQNGLSTESLNGITNGSATANGTTSHSDDAERFQIGVIHFTFGEPEFDYSCDGFLVYREVMVATTASREQLQTFAYQVMQWKIDKDFKEGGLGKFNLRRLKSNADGTSCWWQNEGLKRARPADSVVLVEGQMDSILTDVQKFLMPSTKKWYIKHGLPHRRSYLFYGPPGTGKTSTIRVIASTFKLNCFFLSMTSCQFSNQLLVDALGNVNPNSLLILEDVDALFNMDRKNDQTPSLTFSGLLNALDGVVSVDGILTIMTTNHLERLDPALVRGGRVDRRFFFDGPRYQQVEDLFRSFYPDAKPSIYKLFAKSVMERSSNSELRSLATLQQLFIHHRESTAEECVEGLDDFFRSHFPGEVNSGNKSIYM